MPVPRIGIVRDPRFFLGCWRTTKQIVERLNFEDMKRVKLFIIASIDGYLACPWDDDMEWFAKFSNPGKTDYGYKEFFISTDTVVMDELVYNDIMCMDVIWPYKDKKTFVVSRFESERKSEENIQFITSDSIETIADLKQLSGKDIWLIGGDVIEHFFDLLDEIQLVYIPIIHGNNKPMLPGNLKLSNWILAESKAFDNGAIRLIYQRK